MSETSLVGIESNGPLRSAEGSDPFPQMNILIRGDGYVGNVVIDTIVNGQSAGGVRIAEDVPLDEVHELASEMSLKYALFALPRGGAKTGIRMSPGLDRAQRLVALEDFGRKLAPVIANGVYSPGMDMNCGPDELRAIYRGAGVELGSITDTSWFTAMTVFHALEAVVDRLEIEGRPVTLSIEGFGSVARHLMDRLDDARYRIVSIATIEGAVRGRSAFEPSELAKARDSFGDALVTRLDGQRLDRQQVLADDVDIILPSSRVRSITADLARATGARAVVPIANAPYSVGTVQMLHDRGVICLPGFVSNSGGVLASSLADLGLPQREVESLIAEYFRAAVVGILRVAARRQRPAVEIAESLARLHMLERVPSPTRSLATRVYRRFLEPRRPDRWKLASARREFVSRSRKLLGEITRMEQEA